MLEWKELMNEVREQVIDEQLQMERRRVALGIADTDERHEDGEWEDVEEKLCNDGESSSQNDE